MHGNRCFNSSRLFLTCILRGCAGAIAMRDPEPTPTLGPFESPDPEFYLLSMVSGAVGYVSVLGVSNG